MLKFLSFTLLDDRKYSFWIFYNLVFIVLGIFSIILFLERAAYKDSANMLFQIINSESFFIAHDRSLALITQLLPLLLIKLNASLKLVLVSYSLTPLIINYILGYFSFKVMNNKTLSLLILTIPTVLTCHLFYYNVPEVSMITIVFFLVHISAFYIQKNKLNSIILFTLFLGFILYFSHPLMFLLFYAFLTIITLNSSNRKRFIILGAGITLFLIIKSIVLNYNGYETGLIGKLFNNLVHLKEFNKANFYFFFKENYLHNKIIITVFVLFVIIHLRTGNFLSLAFSLFIGFLFYLFCCLYFWSEWPIKSYADLYTITIFLPLIFSYSQINTNKSLSFLAYLIIPLSLINCYQYRPHYHERVNYIKELTHIQTSDKTLIANKNLNMEIVQFDWIFPIETLLISTVLNSECKTIYTDESISDKIGAHQNHLITKERTYNINELNPKYFKLSSSPYTLAKNIK